MTDRERFEVLMKAAYSTLPRRHDRTDQLLPWPNPVTYRLPSGKTVVAASVSQCRRYHAMGAVKVEPDAR